MIIGHNLGEQDTVGLSTGNRLGPYEIIEPLGAGGMGEVYKARDTRLDRVVAVKILAEEFAGHADRQARFEREARAVAALNHANICALHDVGDTPGLFLVMEYLEGQTLAERLLRGPLPVADVLRYAVEIADALDHAHRHGLVHRDLKPGNVMLTKKGAKLLDFGLSKLQPTPDLIGLSTISPADPPLTASGAVLGTFPYMSPEQLAGREADARSDIFAFGAMVYEMATGTRAFQGSTAATLIGAILHTDPPLLSSRQPLAPPALDRIVSRCLAKDPDDRWQSARDLMLELKWIAEQPATLVPLRKRRTKLGVIAAAALAAVAIAVAAFTLTSGRRPVDDSVVRLSFPPPDGVTLVDVGLGGPVTISPDGRHLAFVAMRPDGRQLLWIRALESPTAQVLSGTDGAAYPFWSPDNQFIGFFAQRKLKKIHISGERLQTLCDAVQPRGGTWNRDDVMIFSANTGHQLYRISAGGGVLTRLPGDGINDERYWPAFLPDGRHFLYRGRPQQHGVYAGALDSSETKLLLGGYLAATYSPGGYLIGLLGTSLASPSGTLLAHPFDATRLEFTGQPSQVAEHVAYRVGLARADFSVSENGTLVYGRGEPLRTQLTWFNRGGQRVASLGGSVSYRGAALSPDEKTVAAERIDSHTESPDVWTIDTARDLPARFTSYPNADENPIWSPDGARIVFGSPRGTPPNLYQKAVAVTGAEERLVKSPYNSQPTDWSRDGRLIVYATLDPETQWDLWQLPMSGAKAGGEPVPVLRTEFNEHRGQVSPDGHWIAYVSDEAGANEVYVTAFPKAGAKRRISANGGNTPRWRGDGRELFYLAADGRLMSVAMRPEAGMQAGTPEALFATRIAGVGAANNWGLAADYTVTRDGQRFLINTVTEKSSSLPTVLLNWPATMSRR